jgi:LytS/YehU family sensor histidine kinase
MTYLVGTNLAVFAVAHASFAMAAVALSGAVEARDRERQLAEARAAATAAQLTALQYQLNPHFLFNTLNAIGSLVETGRASEAGTMLDRLADFLRSTLAGSSGTMTSLDDEFATLQGYLEIESVRFGERMRVELECPAELRSVAVPTFILQPLVENALKHAVAPALRRVTVKVTARRRAEALVLTVEDDGDRPAAARSAGEGGVGLRNTRERLALLYGSRAALDARWADRGFRVAVTLPLDGQAGHG